MRKAPEHSHDETFFWGWLNRELAGENLYFSVVMVNENHRIGAVLLSVGFAFICKKIISRLNLFVYRIETAKHSS